MQGRRELAAREGQRRPLTGVPGRAGAVRAWRRVQPLVERLDPSPAVLRARLRTVPAPPAALVCVYRRRNAGHVAALVDALPAGSAVALWALDEVAPALAPHTAGAGPGFRNEHLNALAGRLDLAGRHLVLVDDDVVLPGTGLPDLLRAVAAARLDLAGPAHASASAVSWRFTRRRSLLLARSTGFVEIGPLVVMSPAAQDRLLPLPEDAGMAWGLELTWAQHRPPLRFGIVDAVPVVHLGAAGVAYASDREHERRDAAVQAAGRSFADLHVVDGTWRPWQRAPGWVPTPPGTLGT